MRGRLVSLTLFYLFSIFLSESYGEEEVFQFYQEEAEVITASKKAERLSDAPGIITVVTRKEIDQFGAVNLVDVLNRVPSVQEMSSHLWVDGKTVMRGDLLTHSDSHVLILLNGRPFREMQEGTGDNTFYKTFPVELIDRIEIVRGPGSVLYGSNAFSGVINVITRKPDDSGDSRPHLTYTGGIGSFGADLQTVSASTRGEDWGLTFAYNAFQDDGWDFSAGTVQPGLPPLYGDTKYGNRDGSFSAFFDYHERLTAELFYAHVENRSLGTLPYWTQEADMDSRRLLVDIGYRHPVSRDWDLKINLTENNYDKGITYIQSDLQEPDKSIGLLEEVSLGGTVGGKTDMVMGIVNDERMSNDVVSTIPNVQRASIPGGFYNRTLSGYFQIDHRPSDWIKLIGGAQYNRIETGAQALVPRAGIIVDLNSSSGLKLLYSEAFRGPTAQERYANLANILLGNPDLSPEKIKTTDAQLFYNASQGRFAVTLFDSKMDNLIIRVPYSGSTQTFVNSGDITIWGAEFEGSWKVAEPLSVTGSATFQYDEDQALYIPDYMVKAGIGYERKGLSAGIFLSHFGKPHQNSGEPLNSDSGAINLLSLNATYRFQFYLPMAINVYGSNLLDDDMSYPEFSKGWVNTLPIGPGKAVYGRLTVSY